jgi:putative chitinase
VKLNRKSFFDNYRKTFGTLNQQQVDGLEFLLGKIENDPEWKLIEEIAYVLATVKHETDDTFQPVKEYRARVGTKLRKTQDRYWLSGYFGRGYVMITWKSNYEKFGIADHPEKALEPETAYKILSEGMRKGTFTGKKLSDFISEKEIDYYEARTIVNGHDKALAIADLAEAFETILRAAEEKDPSQVNKDTPQPEPPTNPSVTPAVTKEHDTPSVQSVGTNPPVVEVSAPQTSTATKVAAAAGPVGTAIAALGIKIGGVELSENAIIALCAVFVVSIIVAGWMWNQSQERRWKRQELSVSNLADRSKNNVVATKIAE